MPRQTRPSRDTARSHTPDAPRAMDSAAASSDVPAVLPRPWMFFNGRLVSADQYARSDPASEVPHSAIPPPPKLPAPATMPATRQSICRMPQRAAASRSATARAVEQCRGPTGRRGRSEAAQDRGGCRQGGAGPPVPGYDHRTGETDRQVHRAGRRAILPPAQPRRKLASASGTLGGRSRSGRCGIRARRGRDQQNMPQNRSGGWLALGQEPAMRQTEQDRSLRRRTARP